MGSRNVLVTVFLLLAAGAGLAWFFAQGDNAGEGRGDGVATATSKGVEDSSRPATDLVDGGGSEVAESAQGEDRMEVAVDPLAAAPAAEDHEAEPTPAISGRVLDPFGRPIVGATVLAADSEGFPLDFVADGPIPPFVNRATATTDAEGRFGFDGLAPPTIRIAIQASGYAPYEKSDIPLPDVESYELADIALDPGAILEGHVVDPFGQGVAGAELFFESTDGFNFRGFWGNNLNERPAAVTDESGRFRIDRLALGAWRIRVESEEHPERAFEGMAERAQEVISRTFELQVGDVVTGRVTDIPKTERGDLVVRATPTGGDEFFGFGGAGIREGSIDKTGEFIVKGLKPNAEYNLQVRMKNLGTRFRGFSTRTRSERIPARSGTQGVEIPYRPEAAVVFQVVDDATDQPIEEFQVESGFRWTEPLLGDDMRPIEVHPEGRVRIGNLRPDDSPASLEVEIAAVGYQTWSSEDVQVLTAQETDLGVIRLSPLPMVRVTVLDASTDQPLEGAHVRMDEVQEDANPFGRGGFRSRSVSIRIDDSSGAPVAVGPPGSSAETDADGVAMLNSLEGKTVNISVRRDGYAPASVTELELPTGAAVEQVIRLGPGGVVVARVVDEGGVPVSGIRVDHREPNGTDAMRLPFLPGRSTEAVSDHEGEVRFANLAAGDHKFRIQKAGGGNAMFGRNMVFAMEGGASEEPGWETVTVSEDSEDVVVLVQQPTGSLQGRLTEVGVELVGASVRLSPKSGGGRGGFDLSMLGGGGEAERTDSSGRYRLEDIEPGEYTLKVTHPKRRMPAEFDVEILAGENTLDAELPLSILEGRVTDHEGRPLAGVAVTASQASGGGRSSGTMMFRMAGSPTGESGGTVTFGDDMGETATTDADGFYSLRGVTPDVELTVRASGTDVQAGESDPVVVPVNELLGGVDLVLEPAGSLQVEVFSADGTTAPFVMVRASYLDEVPEGVNSEGADDKRDFAQGGTASLQGMRPGRWEVTVSPMGPGGGGDSPEPQEITIEFGVESSLTFHLP